MKPARSSNQNILNAAPFRSRAIDGEMLVVSEWGNWTWMTNAEFGQFCAGAITREHPAHPRLVQHQLVLDALSEDDLARQFAERRLRHLAGPALHTLVICGVDGTVMNAETLERVVDIAFLSTSDRLQFVLRSDNESVPLPSLAKATAYIRRKNQLAQKECQIAYAGPLHDPSGVALKSFADLHISWIAEAISPTTTDAVLDKTRAEIKRLSELWAHLGQNACWICAECTPGAANAPRVAEWVGGLLAAGATRISLRQQTPLDGWPHMADTARVEDGPFLELYEQCVVRCLAASSDGSLRLETFAAQALARILLHTEPKFPTLRNPSTDGISELAFGPLGDVFTSFRGYRAYVAGNESFHIGKVPRNGYHDIVSHPTVRTLVVATTLDGQSGWSDHAYALFAGMCPVLSLWEQGSISGRMGDSVQARLTIGMLDNIFRLIRRISPHERFLLESWARQV